MASATKLQLRLLVEGVGSTAIYQLSVSNEDEFPVTDARTCRGQSHACEKAVVGWPRSTRSRREWCCRVVRPKATWRYLPRSTNAAVGCSGR